MMNQMIWQKIIKIMVLMIKKFSKLDSIRVNRNPNLDNELANKKSLQDSIGSDIILKSIQTLKNYHEVSVGNDT